MFVCLNKKSYVDSYIRLFLPIYFEKRLAFVHVLVVFKLTRQLYNFFEIDVVFLSRFKCCPNCKYLSSLNTQLNTNKIHRQISN